MSFIDNFNAEVEHCANWLVGHYSYDEITGIFKTRRNGDIYVKKALRYVTPPELIEMYTFMDKFVDVSANTSANSSTNASTNKKIRKSRAIALRLINKPVPLMRIVTHTEFDPGNLDLSVINFLDWALFIAEQGWLVSSGYFINCNPDSIHYGNILLLSDSAYGKSTRIIFRDMHEFVVALTEWFSYVGSDHSTPPSINDIDEFLDSTYDGSGVGYACIALVRGRTNRYVLEQGKFHETLSVACKSIWLRIEYLSSVNDAQRSFSCWILNQQS